MADVNQRQSPKDADFGPRGVPIATPVSKAEETKEEGASTQHVEEQTSYRQSRSFQNPFRDLTQDELFADVHNFCDKNDLNQHVELFERGALVCQNPTRYKDIPELSEAEKMSLDVEQNYKWRQPWTLYFLTVMCSLAAAVQGMDETVNNGAQQYYLKKFGIEPKGTRFEYEQSEDMTGLIVGAPYLACAVLGCWLTEPLNRLFGRRGTIFISCFVAAAASIWQGFGSTWVNLFMARFVLGLGIGAKSSTVPVYTAECSPAPIRGALVMMWQMWTAFGMMLGNIMGVAFNPLEPDMAWRLMLGSTVVLPAIVCCLVYMCPESPRWLIQRDKTAKAFQSLQRLRTSNIQAARDLYNSYTLVNLERDLNEGKYIWHMALELFTVPRNRRATLASFIVMFLQQFCGINIIAYYSTTIFIESGYSLSSALLASMGAGILNWVSAIPAMLTIDTFGRRNLLLCTLPFLSLWLLFTGFSFWAPDSSKLRVGLVTTGMYLFEIFYGPGQGPVPFTYSAEAFPLAVRDVGMSFATATTWLFNFIISFTWPHMLSAFKPQGGFGWYAAWCLIGWLMVLLFVPETKALSLEELDQVFSVPTWTHAAYHLKHSWWFVRTKILRQNVEPLPPLWQHEADLMEE